MLKYVILKDRLPFRTSNLEEYHSFLMDEKNCRVGLTVLEHGFVVSTVFLAPIDLGLHPPDLFETMVFKDGEPVMARKHQSWQDAEVGHDLMVAQVKAEYVRMIALAEKTIFQNTLH